MPPLNLERLGSQRRCGESYEVGNETWSLPVCKILGDRPRTLCSSQHRSLAPQCQTLKHGFLAAKISLNCAAWWWCGAQPTSARCQNGTRLAQTVCASLLQRRGADASEPRHRPERVGVVVRRKFFPLWLLNGRSRAADSLQRAHEAAWRSGLLSGGHRTCLDAKAERACDKAQLFASWGT
eukprot:3410213-Rhodomonas_salina.2